MKKRMYDKKTASQQTLNFFLWAQNSTCKKIDNEGERKKIING